MATRLLTSAFLLLFAIGFSWAGFAKGLPTLTGILADWHRARSYVAVSASVRSTSLEVTRDEGQDGYRALASFAYRYQDRDYLSETISTSPIGDNFDNYQRIVHARLEQARANGQSVTLWVDPSRPELAFYDRSLRWRAALVMVPFGVVFPAVGIGAWVMLWSLWRTREGPVHTRHLRGQSSPSLREPLTTGVIAFFWNGVSWPIVTLSLADKQGWGLVQLLLLFFPVVGIGLIWIALRMWRIQRRIGEPMLEILQIPDTAGMVPLRGRIHFTPAYAQSMDPSPASHPVRINIKLQQTDGKGEDAIVSTVWETCALDTALARGSKRTEFYVRLPPDVMAAASPARAQRAWKLELKALGAELLFDLDVIPAAGPAAS